MDRMSIQDLRQALRERGAITKGTKQQLKQRLAEIYDNLEQERPTDGTKCRVSVHRYKSGKHTSLVLDTSSGAKAFDQLLEKAGNKFRMKARRAFLLTSGVEITAANILTNLRDDVGFIITHGEAVDEKSIKVKDDVPSQAEIPEEKEYPESFGKMRENSECSSVSSSSFSSGREASHVSQVDASKELLQQFAASTRNLQEQIRAGEHREAKLKERLASLSSQLAACKDYQERYRNALATISQHENLLFKVTSERDKLIERNENLALNLRKRRDEKDQIQFLQKQNTELKDQLNRVLGNELQSKSLDEMQSLCRFYSDGLLKVTTAMSHTLSREKKVQAEKRLCKICYDSEINCLIIPCSHLVSCTVCAESVQNCPICRCVITARKQVFS